MRDLVTAPLALLIVALATGCGGGGGGGASYPGTPGYSSVQVARIFKAHGLLLSHVAPLEQQKGVGRHLRAVMGSTGTGYVAVYIYKSSEEARLAAKAFPQQYSVRARRMYPSFRVVNVLAVVYAIDPAGSRALRKTQAAMADLRRR